MLTYILATVFVLGVLILVHELGHFFVAKAVDIRVPRFSMGLGPKLIGVKRGETEYCISAIPFGGYVKMAGEDAGEFIEGGGDDEEDERRAEPSPRDFDQKPVWARFLVVIAGPSMNYVFGFLIFLLIALFVGVPFLPLTGMEDVDWGEAGPVEGLSELSEGARILEVGGVKVDHWSQLYSLIMDTETPLEFKWEDRDGGIHESLVPAADPETRERLVEVLRPAIPARVGQVQKDSPAEAAGFRRGDVIVSIQGVEVPDWTAAVRMIKMNPETELSVTVLRDGERVDLSVVPERVSVPNDETGEDFRDVGQIGIQSDIPMQHVGILESVSQATRETWFFTTNIVGTVVRLFTGEISPRMLGGPVMIGEMAGNRARWGIVQLLKFVAMFSLNLAILNVLPIPVLDGGHIVFLAAEKVQGRPVSPKLRIRLSQVGMILLILVMIYVTKNDFFRLFGIQ
jgi:regulator of sigma E protease